MYNSTAYQRSNFDSIHTHCVLRLNAATSIFLAVLLRSNNLFTNFKRQILFWEAKSG